MNKISFFEAFHKLRDHNMFKDEYGISKFLNCLDISVQLVNPLTNSIDDCDKLNTKEVVWLECGKYYNKEIYHDYRLDCGGNTFEEAILELYKLVKKYY